MLLTLNLSTLADRLADKWRSVSSHAKRTRKLLRLGLGIENLESRELLTTFTVTTNLDEVSDDSTISLREAINLANANLGDDSIVFSDEADGSIDLVFGQLQITDAVTIQGNGATHTIINAQQNSRVFDLTAAVEFVVFDSLTIANGQTSGDGENGAGIRSQAGTLNVINSAITGNSTTGSQSSGAGIFAQNGVVTLFASTIADNSTSGSNSSGGGVRVEASVLNVQNSTVSGNSSHTASAFGGGLSVDGGGLTISNSTITFNSSDGTTNAGGGVFTSNSDVTLINSIIAHNTNAGAPDLSTTSGSLSITHTLIGSNVGTALVAAQTPDASGNLIGSGATPIDPLLDPLAYHGGSTQTHALQAMSPAINGGLNELVGDASDQRGFGFDRIVGNNVDMGAYERQSLSLLVTTADDEADAAFDAQDLSLREALTLANAYPGLDTITFASGLDGMPMLLTLGQLTITDTVRINGSGVDLTVIDAQSESRVFDITNSAGNVTLQGLTITNGRTAGDGESGGGIRSASTGTLTLSNTTVGGNTTEGSHAAGGGVFVSSVSTLVLTNSTIAGNLTLGSDAGGGGVYAAAGGTLISTGTRISSNGTTGDNSPGGGLYWNDGSVTLVESIISDNSTHGSNSFGGGIASNLADVAITATTVSGNSTIGDASAGGGIFTADGAVSLLSSTVSDNYTHGEDGNGGGVRVVSGSLALVNSTIVNNAAQAATSGGGGLSVDAAALALTNCTVAFNSAGGVSHLGGGISAATGAVTILNSIVAQNTNAGAPDLAPGSGALDIRYTLIGNNTGSGVTAAALGSPDANGNLIGSGAVPIDPRLGLLAAFGGPTKTYSLQGISPAINAGSNALAGGLTLDQRGLPRIYGATVDMGALEHQSAPTDPSVTFSVASQLVSEGDGTVVVTVNLSAASVRNVTIELLDEGTATDSIDYTFSTSILVIPAGSTTGSVTIIIVDDQMLENSETVILVLGLITNGIMGVIPDHTITIENNDSLPAVDLAIDAQSVAENSGVYSFIVNLSGPSPFATTIPFTFSGSAGSPSDYTAGISPLVIPAGVTSATIDVTIVDDSLIEGNETLVVTLGTPTNGTLGEISVETLIINDNDVDNSNTNSAPVLVNPVSLPFYRYNPRETRAPVNVLSQITVSDPNGTTELGTLVISISMHSGKNRDVIAFTGASALGTMTNTIVNGRREFRFTLQTGVTSQQVQALMRSMTFETSRGGLRNANRQVQVSVTDRGGLTSNVVTQNVKVSKN